MPYSHIRMTSINHSGPRISTPFVMVVFGATGDLMQRKLIPALYDLFCDGVIPQQFFLVGFARRPFSTSEFKQLVRGALKEFSSRRVTTAQFETFFANFYYQQGMFDERAGYDALVTLLNSFDTKLKMCVTRFFYLATPPQHYGVILDHLKETKLSEGCGQNTPQFTRILIEKPFGKDLDSARQLDAKLGKTFAESQIYRIDHYLGKETVQNILAFRFANSIFEPIWNKEHINHIQITLSETAGIGNRGPFYEGIGALRDVAQNHLLELIALITMDEPKSFTAENIRSSRAAAIEAIACLDPQEVRKNTVRGQYEGYRSEKNVDPKSMTETFVAMQIGINSKRWQGVPIYLRTGKKLSKSRNTISIHFSRPNSSMFDGKLAPDQRNILTFFIQPNEGISVTLQTKKSGFGVDLEPTTMDFIYHSGHATEIDAYERILIDCMVGDQTLFPTTRSIMASWVFIQKILEGWSRTAAGSAREPVPLHRYTAGSWGPEQAQQLIEREGRKWV